MSAKNTQQLSREVLFNVDGIAELKRLKAKLFFWRLASGLLAFLLISILARR